jgi:hypothetical protein
MPWGSAISVEIASSDYKNKKVFIESNEVMGVDASRSAGTELNELNSARGEHSMEEIDDLDSFFAEIEND